MCPVANHIRAAKGLRGLVLLWSFSNFSEFFSQYTYAGMLIFKLSLEHWVADGLMAVFFLVVGIEIKRELVVGQLSTKSQAALPMSAALGGMIAPALFFLLFNMRRLIALLVILILLMLMEMCL